MAEKQTSPFTRLDTSLLRSTRPSRPAEDASNETEQPQNREPSVAPTRRTPAAKTTQRTSKQQSKPDSTAASKQASTLANYPADLIDAIRKVVKAPGREVSFVRLTPGEKAELAEVVYTYKRKGYRTSENEINRIAVNFILEDYRSNGEDSILARVLDALLA